MPTGSKCSVLGYDNSYKKTRCDDKSIKYHPLPKDEKIRRIWIQSCQRGNGWNPQTAYICSKHFTEQDFVRDLRAELLGLPLKRHVKSTAVPTLYLTQSLLDNEEKLKEHRYRKSMEQQTSCELDFSPNLENNVVSYTVDTAVQTNFYKENYTNLLRRIGNLESIIKQYKDIVQEYRIKNELLESSVKEAAKLIEEINYPLDQRYNKILQKHRNKILISNKADFRAIKSKILLWKSKDRIYKYRLKLLCKGCYVISS